MPLEATQTPRDAQSMRLPGSSSQNIINDYILVIGSLDGGRAPSEVAKKLRGYGERVLYLDYSSEEPFAIELGGGRSPVISHRGQRYGAPLAFWSRFKLGVGSAGIGTPDECLRIMEWSAVARGLGMLFQSVSVNGNAQRLAAETKLHQLEVARRVGFRVPHSQVTFGKRPAQDFLDKHGSTVMKSLGYPIIPDDKDPGKRTAIVTTAVNPDLLNASPEQAFFNNPIFFQRQIDTGFEYRVIAFRNRVFAYRHMGAVNTRRIIDSRVLPREFEQVDPPETLQRLCIKYLELEDLNYSVFDLFCGEEADEAEWTFLECNPEGQFHSAIGINISEIIDKLTAVIRAQAASARKSLTQRSQHTPQSRDEDHEKNRSST